MARAPEIVIALAPVALFLVTLSLMDRFRLVRRGSIAAAVVFGACA